MLLKGHQELSWQGRYDLLQITERTCTCQLGPFECHIVADQLLIEQFHVDYFRVSFQTLHHFSIKRVQ